MSFTNALRSSVRRAAAPAARRQAPTAARTSFRRGYASATEPTGRKTSYTLPLGVGAVLALAGGYYVFTSDAPREADTLKKEAVQVVKAATHTAPTKEQYQDVYNAIVKVMDSDEAAEYDGGFWLWMYAGLARANRCFLQTVRSAPSSSALPGTARARTTSTPTPAALTTPPCASSPRSVPPLPSYTHRI
jgi:hypothetical protein